MKRPGFIETNVSLARHSTLGVGGAVEYFANLANDKSGPEKLLSFEAKVIGACEFARDNELDIFVLGHGSNVLFGERKLDALVLKIGADEIYYKDYHGTKELWADAGVSIAKLVNFVEGERFTGFEFLAGLPGTVGGAVYGNAGCYGGQFWDMVEEVAFFDGEYIQTKKKSDGVMFDYRWSIFKDNPTFVILAVKLAVISKEAGSGIQVASIQAMRLANQPRASSLGCIFKNPKLSNGRRVPAGKLIDEAGLKAYRIGGAMISSQHANFFVNTGRARAKDFMELINLAKGMVLEKFGVMLEEEIIRVGEF